MKEIRRKKLELETSKANKNENYNENQSGTHSETAFVFIPLSVALSSVSRNTTDYHRLYKLNITHAVCMTLGNRTHNYAGQDHISSPVNNTWGFAYCTARR
jgi:hypothetical protein